MDGNVADGLTRVDEIEDLMVMVVVIVVLLLLLLLVVRCNLLSYRLDWIDDTGIRRYMRHGH